jgi:outer membrane immunogenic protein
MRFLTTIGVALAAAGIASAASAADMPARMATKAPAYVSPVYNWTGLYLGVNAGYGWATSSFGDADGFVGGGQIGYNWQAMGSPLVLGLEADLQGADMDSSAAVGAITATGRVNAFGTVRGRVGFAWDRFMAYGTAGWAYTRTSLSLTGPGGSVSDSDWSSGYAVGGGLEWAAWNRWSVKLEYLYVNSGDVTLTLAGVPVTGDYDFSVVRAGLNYRF